MKSPMEEFFQRHERVALHFSAGKDSAACLWALEQYWPRMTVMWCNPGNAYPETEAYMMRIAQMVPRFEMVQGNQPANIKAFGYPVDIIPFDNTPIGAACTGKATLKLQPFWQCCAMNLWQPLEQAVKAGGYDGVIRGQKGCDALKAPMESGTVVDGVEYLFPLQKWSDEDVVMFLRDRIPESYKRGLKSSLDCMNCTAYLKENPGRFDDLLEIDHDAAVEVLTVKRYLAGKLAAYQELLES